MPGKTVTLACLIIVPLVYLQYTVHCLHIFFFFLYIYFSNFRVAFYTFGLLGHGIIHLQFIFYITCSIHFYKYIQYIMVTEQLQQCWITFIIQKQNVHHIELFMDLYHV